MKSQCTLQLFAKNTLAELSDQNILETWSYFEKDNKLFIGSSHRMLKPIKHKKSMLQTRQNFFGKTANNCLEKRSALIPRKVSLNHQNLQEQQLRTKRKALKQNKQNHKPLKTLRSFYSFSKRVQQKQEQQKIDVIQYWIKHRFQEGSINALVEKVRENKVKTMTSFY